MDEPIRVTRQAWSWASLAQVIIATVTATAIVSTVQHMWSGPETARELRHDVRRLEAEIAALRGEIDRVRSKLDALIHRIQSDLYVPAHQATRYRERRPEPEPPPRQPAAPPLDMRSIMRGWDG